MAFAVEDGTQDYVLRGSENLVDESSVTYNQSIIVEEGEDFMVNFVSGSSCSGADGCISEIPLLIQVEPV